MRLTEAEHAALTEIATSIIPRPRLTALCAYGSKVAGYARPDSDYDLLAVAHNFREGVGYRYLESPMQVSALVVDEGLLAQDAATSSLGEFVAGRFLNVYEPILNPGLFRRAELGYKRRVMAEALLELSSDYGDFSKHFLVPFDYFLFDKLRKRSLLYPPALYSYAQTYSCSLGAENRSISSRGFEEASAGLASKGFVRLDEGGVRVVPEKVKGDAFTKVQSLFSLTTRGVTQYAVHGYAGRVGLSVFRKEAQSKLRRMREKIDPLPELERPKSLLKLSQGVVIPDASRLEKELAEILGFRTFSVAEKLIGDPYSTTRILTFSSEGRSSSVVLKNFSDVRSLKWALLGVWAVAANKFTMTPLARLEREYAVTESLGAAGVKVPTILAVSPDVRILVKRFIEGPTLSRVIDEFSKGEGGGLESVASYGRLVADVHAAGYGLGDAKASNVIVSSDGLYLTDLEQADPNGDRAWDLAEFVYYTAKLSNRADSMKRVAEVFLRAYSSSGEREVIAKAGSAKYLRPFQPFILPWMAKEIRDLMTGYV